MTEANGATGRFERIERKLDALAEDVGELKVNVARLQEQGAFQRQQQTEKVSGRSYRLMRFGIIASFLIGLGTFLYQVFFR